MANAPAAVSATKFIPPRPPHRYLSRRRLIDGIESSVVAGRGFVLVSAPAGSGKSTLVDGWLETTDAVVAAVVNTLSSLDGEVVLVIDDYHLINNEEVNDSVERLLAQRPTNCIVVVSTRLDPPFRLGRLRVRGEITEVRAADLRFDVEEAAWLLDADVVGLDADDVGRLAGRTEGWAAVRGVQLARRSPENVMLSSALASAADVAFDHDHCDAERLLLEARAIVDRCADPGIAGRYLGRVESRHGLADRVGSDALVEELTDRELAVLRYLPSRLSQREIAKELYVSLNTVKTHGKAIYRKLAVDGRQAAVDAARQHGLL